MSVLKVFEPTPQRPPLKRSFIEYFDPEIQGPALKRRREGLSVGDWLNNIPSPEISRSQNVPATTIPFNALADISRSQSVSPDINDNQDPPAIEDIIEILKSPSAVDEMGDHQDNNHYRCDDNSFSQHTGKSSTTKTKSISTSYRSILEYNNVQIDPTGSKISNEVRSLLDTDILKKRTSPRLSQDQLKSTGESMNKWERSTENVVNSFISSHMFPIHQPGIQPGIALGGNSPWPRAALPYNQDFGFPISTPKPNYHVSYDTGIKSGFSAQQAHVINHPQVRPYTQPGTARKTLRENKEDKERDQYLKSLAEDNHQMAKTLAITGLASLLLFAVRRRFPDGAVKDETSDGTDAFRDGPDRRLGGDAASHRPHVYIDFLTITYGTEPEDQPYFKERFKKLYKISLEEFSDIDEELKKFVERPLNAIAGEVGLATEVPKLKKAINRQKPHLLTSYIQERLCLEDLCRRVIRRRK